MSLPAISHYGTEYTRAEHTLPGEGLPWLKRMRADAMARFTEEGFPTTKDEAWKYTNVAEIEKRPFQCMLPVNSKTIDASPWFLHGKSQRLTFIDGRYAPALSQVIVGLGGVTVTSIADLLVRKPQRAEPWIKALTTPFANLNTAFLGDGAFIEIDEDTDLKEPIHLLYISTTANLATHTRNIIVAGAKAQAIIVEQYLGLSEDATFTNAVTQLFLGPGSCLEHCKLQQESQRAFHIATIEAYQSEASTFTSHSLSLGAALARHDISSRFDGPHCSATLNGLYVVGGQQHVDHHTQIDHASPHGTSREFYRGILDDHSRAVFSGRVMVQKAGQQTDASQINNNLLLSAGSEVDTRLQLEIYADDVKCSHGATIGQLDDNMLFYLRARGIDEDLARTMLIHAFARELLNRLPFDMLREQVEMVLIERMPSKKHIKDLL